jgi:hypothetical protein
MSILQETHEIVAFLALLCALVFSWNATGRRVANAVVGLQFLLGIVLAAMMGAQHAELPPLVWLHLVIGAAALAAYGVAMRAGKRAGGSQRALTLSVVAVLLVALNVYLGLHMAGML